MTKVEFYYKGYINEIFCKEDEKMEEICKRYSMKTQIDINTTYFLYSGNKINLQLTYSQIINNIDRQRKVMSVLVFDMNTTQILNANSNVSNMASHTIPICPNCKENITLDLFDYKLYLSECKNNHSINMLINEFKENQKFDLKKIQCNICKNTKDKTYNNEMNKCINCKIILCPLCKNIHDKKHKIINYDLQDYICLKHNVPFTTYCKSCNMNICIKCQKEHKGHDILLFGEFLVDKDELVDKISLLKNEIDISHNNINEIINKLNNVRNNMEILYKIINNMVEKYDEKYLNYEILMTLNNINNNKIIDDIKRINEINNINYKFENYIDIYNKMISKDEKMNLNDEITIIYRINGESNIKIFDDTFVGNNKDNCKIIYENKEYQLTELFNVEKIKNNKLEIKLKNIDKIDSMKAMFYKCKSLISLPDISKWNTKNITDMSFLFYGCELLKSLPDLSKWDISNVINIESMFTECKSLESLPDISNWNTKKVKNINQLFTDCNSLQSLPDISNWDVSSVINMKFLFFGCHSLESLPDISNWNTNNVKDMNGMFESCKSLKSLPDISKWNIEKVKDKKNMFTDCSKSLNIPKNFI